MAAVTGSTLAAVILAVGPVSGVHLSPVVTLARTLSDTSTGISPADVAGFVAAQVVGAVAAVAIVKALYWRIESVAGQILVPHDTDDADGAAPI